jgi:hypothetical protein
MADAKVNEIGIFTQRARNGPGQAEWPSVKGADDRAFRVCFNKTRFDDRDHVLAENALR